MRRTWSLAMVAVLAAAAPSAARAQGAIDENSKSPYGLMLNDQRLYVHGILNEFEGRFGSADSSLRWDAELWAGNDVNRLWLKSEGEVGKGGTVTDGQDELLYDRPITTYFDLQTGIRSDIDSSNGRTWAAFGVEGLAPYFFELAATAYASDTGHYAAKISGLFDLLITQRVILQPVVEANFYTKEDRGRRIGSGLSDIDTGLRLRYEITRKTAPYIGVSYARTFAGSENFAHAAGETPAALRLDLGIRAWF
jgi:copper resistance protein B